MKLCLVDTGITSSTFDVFNGLAGAFRRAGHEVIRYQLTARIRQADYMLQRAWQDAGKPANRPTKADVFYRAAEGIHATVLRHQTPFVLVVTSQFFHPDHLVFLQRIGVQVGIVCTESPYGDGFQAHFLQATDDGWTQERTSVDRLRQANPNVWYLPAAYNPDIHHPEPAADEPDVPAHDVVLVATAFAERIKLLQAVDWTGIDLGLYGDWAPLAPRSRLRKFVRGGITDNRVAAALYRRAKVGLNLYRDGLILAGAPGSTLSYDGAESVPAESVNPRALELAACGCFQVSQHRAEVADIFGTSVPTFQEPAELQDIIREVLAKPERRLACAEQAHSAVLGRHSFDARVAQIIENVTSQETAASNVVALRR